MNMVKSLVILSGFILFFSCEIPNLPSDDEITSEDLVGTWLHAYPYYPDTSAHVFHADGTYEVFDDYNQTQLLSDGSWSFNDTSLNIDSMIATVRDLTEDELILDTGGGPSLIRFFSWRPYPTGSAFNGATVLSLNQDHTINFTSETVHNYIFNVNDGDPYTISWDDQFDGSKNPDTSPVFDGDIEVTAFKGSFENTPYFSEEDNGYTTPFDITAVGDQILLKVHAMYPNSSVSIRVDG